MTQPVVDFGDGVFSRALVDVDPLLEELIRAEMSRQEHTLNMVPSENFAPRAVMEAQGSILTNKYADGYPGERLYDGCEIVDQIEELAIERAKTLFGAEHANVQPYSGSNANAAVIQALCDPGDAILGFDDAHGGHSTHHWEEQYAGRFHDTATYHVRKSDHLIDMDEVGDLARRHRPKMIIAGWSMYSRVMDVPAFRQIADEVGAYLVVDMAHFSGLVAAGIHPSPVGLADVCTMTTHKTLGGARAGAILSKFELSKKIDWAVFPGTQGGPLVHVIAANAVTFAMAATPMFKERMARTVGGARTVCSVLNGASEQTGVEVVTGGTDVHQFHLDVFGRDVDAAVAMDWLHEISVQGGGMRLAHDRATPPSGSGVRLGTTSLATRGFDTADFVELGEILALLFSRDNQTHMGELAERTSALATAHRVYTGA